MIVTIAGFALLLLALVVQHVLIQRGIKKVDTISPMKPLQNDLAVVKNDILTLLDKVAQLHEKVEPPAPDPVDYKAYQACLGGIIQLRHNLQHRFPEISDEEFTSILERAVWDLVNGTNRNR